MPMDPQLAAIYGTGSDESDVEKLAAAELAEDLAEDGEIDLSNVDPEEVEAMAQAVLADSADDEGAEVEEPQEKIAEADYLGRVMAHAYTQELRKIASADGELEKDAGERWNKVKAKTKETAGKVKAHIGRNKKKYIAGAATAGLAVGGYAGRKHIGRAATAAKDAYRARFPKKASALDTLAEQRALEILAENGIDPNDVEKTSSAESEMDVLAQAVEQRAFEILEANGFVNSEE